jgi:hypothetical protein
MKDRYRRAYRNPRHILFVIAALALTPSLARADAGVPMLLVAYPVILYFLALVILIEAIYLRLRLRTRWWKTLSGTTIANGVTMLLGYPLMWLIYLVLEFALFAVILAADKSGLTAHLNSAPDNLASHVIGIVATAAWMGPWPGQQANWPILLAFVVLLIPSFFLSGWIESKFLGHKYWIDADRNSRRAVWQANILSYVFLAIAGCLMLNHQLNLSKYHF